MTQFTSFIPENIAIAGTKRIGIYNEKGNRVGQIPLSSLQLADCGAKLYSFGALSDVHIVYETATSDFQKALAFLSNMENMAFVCISGDLTDDGTEVQLAQYKATVDAYSEGTPVYAIPGNHEYYNEKSMSYLERYTGYPLYYSFEYGNDVFLMCGCYSWATDGVFTQPYLQWIYETLEKNRNKRCFIFEHVFPWGDSGNPGELYMFDIFSGEKGAVFQSLMRHYKNTVLFHGHSHTKFYLQKMDHKANYSKKLGYHSVHIPSLAVPRDIVNTGLSNIYAASEGYVVDVYEKGIHLRGYDFVKGEYLPIASYWLNTALQPVEGGTYADVTGMIVS